MRRLSSLFGARGRRSEAPTLDNPRFVMSFIAHMVVPMFVLDREGKVVVWNEACEKLTGLEASKVIGGKDHWKGFYLAPRPCLADLALTGGGANVGALYAAHDKQASNQDRMKAQNWCDLPRGVRVYLAIDAGVIRDAQGEVIAVVETLQNMTAVKEAEMSVEVQRETQARDLDAIRTHLGEGLDRLARGDLQARVDTPLPEAADALRMNFNAAAKGLQDLLVKIVATSETIDRGAAEIAASTEELSTQSESQTAGLNEATTALGEITGAVRKTAEGADNARNLVAAAETDAEKGGIVVGEAIAAINGIEKASKQISQIIGVIDEIAFQTNLLALNAGVEAARAGDAGRGFAVVASEVRALAQRSAEAAKEIKSLISTSSSQVDSGVQLVAESGKALDRIIAQVSKINGIVSEIATSAEQQATGLQQVNTAISQMDETTQQNASMVEESNAASHSLSQETTQLANLVEQFQVEGRDGAALRRELRRVAPHAFAKPAAAEPTKSAPVAVVRPAPAAAKPASAPPIRKAAAGGGGVAVAAKGEWTEF